MKALGSIAGSIVNFVKGNALAKTLVLFEAGATVLGGLLELMGVHLGSRGWKELLAGAGLVALLFGTVEWARQERVAMAADHQARAVTTGDFPVSVPTEMLPDPSLAAKDPAVARYYAQPALKTYDPTTGTFNAQPSAASPQGTLWTPVTPDGQRSVPQVTMPETPNTYDGMTSKLKERFAEGLGGRLGGQ